MSSVKYVDANVIEILKSARALVVAGWTQHTEARDAADEAVPTRDPRARKFSASGAISRSGGGREACAALGYPLHVIHAWNNDPARTQQEVIAAFDAAIAAARAFDV